MKEPKTPSNQNEITQEDYIKALRDLKSIMFAVRSRLMNDEIVLFHELKEIVKNQNKILKQLEKLSKALKNNNKIS